MWEAELLGNPFSHVLVAVRRERAEGGDGNLIGFHCFWVVFEELRLMRLAVRESKRGQGVGRALATVALEWGRQRGVSRAMLEVRSSNEAAQRLYQGLGFFSTGIRRGYYSNPTEDAVLMEMNPLALPVGIPPRQVEGGWQRDNEGR
ncbi:MAG: ribosomal protein S18-alanine N-acetyltransferase [Nitrospira sp.]|nr:ribosomal protein S18-alanine N-acetyltransferase [Nitrospira sp.]MCP9465585.1 ribosomal protein S18-alanine N-acetyltransferase [Nitrospira sp.]